MRIIGLPGEDIEIRESAVLINKEPLDEPYLNSAFARGNYNFNPMKVSDKSYFALGDNRPDSFDSRYWGPVPKNLIFGKVLLHK